MLRLKLLVFNIIFFKIHTCGFRTRELTAISKGNIQYSKTTSLNHTSHNILKNLYEVTNLNNHRPILIELHSVLKFAERIVNDSKPGLISPLWSFSSCLVFQSCLHLHNDLHNDVWCNLFGTSSIIVQFFIHLMDHTRQPPASSTGIPPP